MKEKNAWGRATHLNPMFGYGSLGGSPYLTEERHHFASPSFIVLLMDLPQQHCAMLNPTASLLH
jgi:hypothetical protein